jgi:hypothetical protein
VITGIVTSYSRILVLSIAVCFCLPNAESASDWVLELPLDIQKLQTIKVGPSAVTTVQFPEAIQAIIGYGFNITPNWAGMETDNITGSDELFHVFFDRGTNFLSLKAARSGAKGNLNVVLHGSVFSFLCEQLEEPNFVVRFHEPSGNRNAYVIPQQKDP